MLELAMNPPDRIGRIRKWPYALAILGIALAVAGCVAFSGPTPTTALNASVVSGSNPSAPGVAITDAFIPSGRWGDENDTAIDPASPDNPYAGPTCVKISYSALRTHGYGWSWLYWRSPENSTGHTPGLNLTGNDRVTFFARGAKGGEKVTFNVGGVPGQLGNSVDPASTTGLLSLTDRWQPYTIDLHGRDLSSVDIGFAAVFSADDNPHGCTIYLDNMKFEP